MVRELDQRHLNSVSKSENLTSKTTSKKNLKLVFQLLKRKKKKKKMEEREEAEKNNITVALSLADTLVSDYQPTVRVLFFFVIFAALLPFGGWFFFFFLFFFSFLILTDDLTIFAGSS
jgi:hypothetical protein